MKLHLGFEDSVRKKADILEYHFDIVHLFYQAKWQYIESDIAKAYAQSYAETMKEGKLTKKAHTAALYQIRRRFRRFLDLEELNGIVEGVPTKVAVRENRPSFIDTGEYRVSFVPWIIEDDGTLERPGSLERFDNEPD